MRQFIILILLAVAGHCNYAQDLIVTTDGDSIQCRITSVKPDFIYFTFLDKDEARNTLLPRDRVKTHQFGVYSGGQRIGRQQPDLPRFRFAVQGGYSYRTAKVSESVPADFRNYIKKLKSGYHIGADASWFFSEQIGVGLRYSMFRTSNSANNIYLEDEWGNRTYGEITDDITISFVGPTLAIRALNPSQRNGFFFSVGLGYLGYHNNGTLINRFRMTGGTFGMALDAGYDIGLSKNLSLGFQISSLAGTLSSYNLTDGVTTQKITLEKEEFESLNRLDFSVGLRYTIP